MRFVKLALIVGLILVSFVAGAMFGMIRTLEYEAEPIPTPEPIPAFNLLASVEQDEP